MTRDWWPGGDGLNKTMNGGGPSPNNYKNIEWYYYDAKYVDDGEYTGVENRGIKIRSLVFDFIDSVRDERPSSFCNP